MLNICARNGVKCMFNEIRNETLVACIFHALLLRKGVAEGT